MEIKITTNIKEVDKFILETNVAITNFVPALKETGEVMVKSIRLNFDSEGRPIKWQSLSSMTIANRRKGTGLERDKILKNNGKLYNSITYKVGENKQSVQIGTNINYAKKLHYGGINIIPAHSESVKAHWRQTKFGKVRVKQFSRDVKSRTFKVPPRPFVVFQEEDYDKIKDIFKQHIISSLSKK